MLGSVKIKCRHWVSEESIVDVLCWLVTRTKDYYYYRKRQIERTDTAIAHTILAGLWIGEGFMAATEDKALRLTVL